MQTRKKLGTIIRVEQKSANTRDEKLGLTEKEWVLPTKCLGP